MYKLKTNPWSHQWKALDYTMTHPVAGIFTDMGSGKTKIMIDTVVNRDFGLVLIVGTKKSCDVWEEEIKVHSDISPELVFNLCEMSSASKTTFLTEKFGRGRKYSPRGVFIVNYESVWREPFSKLILKTKFDCIICDESHKLKSPSGKASRFLARMTKKVPCRYILSGTPTSESPLDIYGQYRFLNPDVFGTNYGNFKAQYENVDIQKTAFAGYTVLDNKEPYKNLDLLKEKIYSCAFYIESRVELPETSHTYIEAPLSKKAQEIYKELNKEGVYEDEDGVLETNNILAKQTRLQQLLSGYLKLETENFTQIEQVKKDISKVDALTEILENIAYDEKVVVFAKYREDFERIKKVCKTLKRTYGEISGVRDDYLAWKKNKINLIAVQYDSGAESISLVESKYCIYYSHTFSYGKYKQSLKRIHRPGQNRPVRFYHIISTVKGAKTVDQNIKQALLQKKSLSEYLLGAGD